MLRIDQLTTDIASDSGLVRAVDGVTLALERGETFALVGESGCGKSMTALSLLRLLPDAGHISAGSIHLDGTDLTQLPEAQMRDVRGRRIGIVFQEPGTSLNPVLTVGRQVTEVIERHTPLRGAAAQAKALEWLGRVHLPQAQQRFHDYPFQLSGGQKQRVMIAMALAAEPQLLIADEPTTALDVTIQAQILDLLQELQAERTMAVLLITHDLAVVARMAHRVALMYAGQVIEVAPAPQFFAQPLHPYAANLFGALPEAGKRGQALVSIPGTVPALNQVFTACRFAERCTQATPDCHRAPPPLLTPKPDHAVRCILYQDASRAVSLAPPRGAIQTDADFFPLPPSGERARERGATPLLDVRDYRVWFPIRKGLLQRTVGYVKAVDGVSFALASGRTLALVGESGSGKTTVGKGILQLLRHSAHISGTATLHDQALEQLNGAALRRARRSVQIVFQDPFASLNPRLRVQEILDEGVASLCPELAPAQRQQRLLALLDRVGLRADALARYPHEFSGGQRQRLAIARALAVEPQLIVADEPTSALDVSVQAQILNLLQELQHELGVAYLFITHNFGVVEYLAHDIAVMHNGRLVEMGSAEAVLTQPQHAYTRTLLAAVPRLHR